jgi:hypothetical protein
LNFLKILILNSYTLIIQREMSFFFFYKIREQECRTGPLWGIGISGRGRREEKGRGGEYGANTVHTFVNFVNGKVIPVDTIPVTGRMR